MITDSSTVDEGHREIISEVDLVIRWENPSKNGKKSKKKKTL